MDRSKYAVGVRKFRVSQSKCRCGVWWEVWAWHTWLKNSVRGQSLFWESQPAEALSCQVMVSCLACEKYLQDKVQDGNEVSWKHWNITDLSSFPQRDRLSISMLQQYDCFNLGDVRRMHFDWAVEVCKLQQNLLQGMMMLNRWCYSF